MCVPRGVTSGDKTFQSNIRGNFCSLVGHKFLSAFTIASMVVKITYYLSPIGSQWPTRITSI